MIEVFDPDSHWFFRLAKRVATEFFRFSFRWKVVGAHHVPDTGPIIISSNHIHYLDPPAIGASIRRATSFMAKEELFRNRWIGNMLRILGAFPVRRGTSDKAAIKYALAVPANGHCLTVFPEGHRSKDGKLAKGLTGVAFIARKANCPIVPAAVIGPYRFRKPLTVRFGAPIFVNPDDTNESLLERIMQQIQLLLDEGHAL
ncbi:1-acyl-sn-glycerol-3-phosphate acyltransferase [Alicyclobacillus tolerans]|uniref:lysophospholipid acyltransferase family protein n=1 Tax=Alicyclobacillus tolerans TaxID=90970 RepID=UPI001F29581B|nr:lysophospholipid acyltransferase family protein [Alicyclobacillus tolerans]MCF8563722.1 1-acyl-sn-glycerol-3-phosphate acyltransferase [Alicyclobacillus tolerans]